MGLTAQMSGLHTSINTQLSRKFYPQDQPNLLLWQHKVSTAPHHGPHHGTEAVVGRQRGGREAVVGR
jgi:hypothetical protein